jgi:hypothetical protein
VRVARSADISGNIKMPAFSRKIEALAEAIAHVNGYGDPCTESHACRNPGGLLATSPRHLRNEKGLRIFASALDGWQSLMHDVEVKISGQSKYGLTGDSTLIQLAAAYGWSPATAKAWSKFMRYALDTDIQPFTNLKFFEDKEDKNV